MKRQWRTRREWVELADGQCRWDRAYQYLLRWASPIVPEQSLPAASGSLPTQEVCDENRRVCPSVDPTSSARSDH